MNHESRIEQAPATLGEIQALLFSLRIGDGVTFFPYPFGTEGYFLEKRANRIEWYWKGGENGAGSEMEEEEEIQALAETILTFVSSRRVIVCYYSVEVGKITREDDEQAIGAYEVYGPDAIQPEI